MRSLSLPGCFLYIRLFYKMHILSPKLKNLYFSSTAVLYAFITLSNPAKADTSMISVLSGRWKFVMSPSSTLNSNPGYMKISVHPSDGHTQPSFLATDSSVRQLVVPTAITLFPLRFVSFISFAVAYGRDVCAEGISSMVVAGAVAGRIVVSPW